MRIGPPIKVVKIDERNCQRLLLALGAGKLSGPELFKPSAIHQSGKGIEEGVLI